MRKKKVLVADDDPGILEVIKIILEGKEFEIVTAVEGSEVFQRLKECVPDVLLIDLWMSGIDGDVVIKELKSQPATSDIPIIAMSALADGRNRALSAGADAFLAKPFDIEVLSSLIEKYASRS